MRTKDKVYDYLFHCGLEREDYNSVKPHLLAENFRLWRLSAFFFAIIFLVSMIFAGTYEQTHYPDVWQEHIIIYAISAGFYLIVGILLLTCATMKRPHLTSWVIYIAGIYGLCVSLHSACTSNYFSVLLASSLICLPFLYLDKPYKNFLYIGISAAIYIIFTIVNKDRIEFFYFNITGILATAVIGIAMSSIVNHNRIINTSLKLRYEKQRSTDSLTKVNNKTAFDNYVESINAQLKTIDIRFAVVVFDVNWLKETNDTYGHNFGDELLMRTAELIKEVFKTEIYRIGGDEFCCILTEENYEHVEYLVQNFRLKVESIHNSVSSLKRDTSVACGFSKCIPSDCEFIDVFVRADNEMYKDKEKIKSQRDFGFEVISN